MDGHHRERNSRIDGNVLRRYPSRYLNLTSVPKCCAGLISSSDNSEPPWMDIIESAIRGSTGMFRFVGRLGSQVHTQRRGRGICRLAERVLRQMSPELNQ